VRDCVQNIECTDVQTGWPGFGITAFTVFDSKFLKAVFHSKRVSDNDDFKSRPALIMNAF
jgi:hypothetical protein